MTEKNSEKNAENTVNWWVYVSLACTVVLILLFILDRIERGNQAKELQAMEERLTIVQLAVEQAMEKIDIQKRLDILAEKMDELKHELEDIKERQ